MKRILLACGTSFATSMVVTHRLDEAMEKRGLAGKYTTSQCRISEIPSKIADFDILITSSKSHAEAAIPVFNGLPLLTGVGANKIWDEIAEIINQ